MMRAPVGEVLAGDMAGDGEGGGAVGDGACHGGGAGQAVDEVLGARPLVRLHLQAVPHQLLLLIRAVLRHPAATTHSSAHAFIVTQ